MKRRHSLSKSPAKKSKKPKAPILPDWLNDESVAPPYDLSPEELTALAKDVRRSIQDTPAWKALVKRHGKMAALRVLKLALYSRHIIKGNPGN